MKNFIDYIKRELEEAESRFNQFLHEDCKGECADSRDLIRASLEQNLEYEVKELLIKCLDRALPETEIKNIFSGYSYILEEYELI